MDQSISAIVGAVLFAAFVLGLAESIGSVAFFTIVGIVVALMGYSTFEMIRDSLRLGKPHKPSK